MNLPNADPNPQQVFLSLPESESNLLHDKHKLFDVIKKQITEKMHNTCHEHNENCWNNQASKYILCVCI